jgi:hypothetical protein
MKILRLAVLSLAVAGVVAVISGNSTPIVPNVPGGNPPPHCQKCLINPTAK